jgi:shikimate kinase
MGLFASKKNIYLTGFMGSGKTTVGRRLARKLGWKFLDTDKIVQKYFGKPISQIFIEDGEALFRQAEALVLRTLRNRTQTVVSLGGGAILKESNRDILRSGHWIFLDVPLSVIKTRVLGDNSRPLLAKRWSTVEALSRKRLPLYQLAPITVRLGVLSPDAACHQVLAALSR